MSTVLSDIVLHILSNFLVSSGRRFGIGDGEALARLPTMWSVMADNHGQKTLFWKKQCGLNRRSLVKLHRSHQVAPCYSVTSWSLCL